MLRDSRRGLWSPKWSLDWPTWVQKGSHFEAQNRQILVGICAWRLHGRNLASCWHVLLGFWATGANPQLFLKAWSPKWSPDWPTGVQKGGHFEAQKWEILVGICARRLHGRNLASCWYILPGFWAPGANPQLFLRAWSPKWTPDSPTWVQKGGRFEAQ